MKPGEIELEIDASIPRDHAMMLMNYIVAIRRDAVRGVYIDRRMEIRDALVNALPLPMHYAGVRV